MKKYIIMCSLLLVGLYSVLKAQDILVIEMNDNTTRKFKVEDICQMTFQTSQTSGTDPSCPVAEAIDLGLPSGTLWASWNIGASAPEEYGGYFAWGEKEEKGYYDWSTYKWCYGSYITLTKYCYDSYYGNNGFTDGLTELLPEDDAATANWGSPWHMPTKDQIKELIDNCTQTWTQQNGVNGTLVSGPNGRSIFLPAAGNRWRDGLEGEGSYGDYWSSSLSPYNSNGANYLGLSNWGLEFRDGQIRDVGLSVRAVCP